MSTQVNAGQARQTESVQAVDVPLLPPEELARRLVAARHLRGIEQTEVGDYMQAEGYGKHDIAKMERCDPSAPPLNRGRRLALSDLLRVPEWWFTADDDDLFPATTGDEPVAALERHMTALFHSLADRLDDNNEILREHLLPFLARQLPHVKDDAPDGHAGGGKPPMSPLGNRGSTPRERRRTSR
jgi:hypothetical protein